MCGRIVLISPVQALMREFQLADGPDWQPGYNIAPGRDIPAVAAAEIGPRLRLMHWGITPPWSRPDKPAPELINARSESVGQKAVFAESFARRRCVIPVDAFYEWQRRATGSQPYLFQAAGGGLLALAGIWNERPPGCADTLAACAILTTAANGTMIPVHDRMPVILPEGAWRLWLEPETAGERLVELCRPVADSLLTRHPVTRRVGRPEFDDPECLLPSAPAEPPQGDLFG